MAVTGSESWPAAAAASLLVHELRRPMALIRGYASLLQDGSLENGEAIRVAAQTIVREADRMEDLIDGVLNDGPQDFDVVGVVRAAVARVRDRAPDRQMTIVVQGVPNDHPVLVYAARAQVQCILGALLDNAITYSPGPTPVAITISAGTRVEIHVRDAGSGIPAEEQRRVFERGCRLNADIDGRGVGLATSRELAQTNGGGIDLEWSEPGVGSAFRLWLPSGGGPARWPGAGVALEDQAPAWAARIREWRLKNGWTQDGLAHRLKQRDQFSGCDGGTVSRWERGIRRPSPLHEELICQVYEASILACAPEPPKDRRSFVRRALGLDADDV